MEISEIAMEEMCRIAIREKFNPNDFRIHVDPIIPYTSYEVQFDYIPIDQHRKFKLRPFYEAGATSEYMIRHQIVSQLEMFMEQIKPREEWPNDQNKLETYRQSY